MIRNVLNSSVPAALLVPPVSASVPSAAAWGAANRVVFSRLHIPTTTPIRYFNWVVGVSSGNVQVGVVALSGANRTSFTRIVHSGVIACPTAGDVRTDLGLTYLPGGDYALFIWADNTTVTTRTGTNSGNTAMRMCAVQNSYTTGVPASGSFSWGQAYVSATLEADV